MTDLLFPRSARVNSSGWRLIANTAAARSIFIGSAKTLGRTGDRYGISIRVQNANDREAYPLRAALKGIRTSLRGQANRIWINDSSYTQRGSFPSTELLTNNTFSNGTTGWTSGTTYSQTVADRILKTQRNAASVGAVILKQTPTTVVQYAPYVNRAMILPGVGTYGTVFDVSPGSLVAAANSSYGLVTRAYVPITTSDDFRVQELTSTGPPGDYLQIPYASLSRCALVDNGQNLLTYSDDITQGSAWTQQGLSPTYGATGPDGTATASRIIETSATSGHYAQHNTITISSAVADFALCSVIIAGTRSWSFLQLQENTSSTSISVFFNATTGALGTTSTGANWSNLRTFIKNMGGGFYLLSIVGRKTNAATSLTAFVGAASADNVASYTGTASANALNIWRVTLAQSSVPTRQALTTTSALATGTSQTGATIYTKGFPASTNGLLVDADAVQVGTQLNNVNGSIDSDALGLSSLKCALPWRASPADNDPVIINNPMARCVLTDNAVGWSNAPGGFSDFDFDFEEALDQ